MIWIVLFAVGAGILAFWPIYDWIKARKTELQKDLGTTGQPVSDSWIKREIWDCPVCGKDHGGNRRERNRENCPFADGDYYHVWEEHLLDSTVTNFGGHFGLPYIVWEYDSKVYLTYKPDRGDLCQCLLFHSVLQKRGMGFRDKKRIEPGGRSPKRKDSSIAA